MAVRVYELAKKNGLTSKDLLSLLSQKGFTLSSHVSVVPSEAIEVVELHILSGKKNELLTNTDSLDKKHKEVIIKSEIKPEVNLKAQNIKNPEINADNKTKGFGSKSNNTGKMQHKSQNRDLYYDKIVNTKLSCKEIICDEIIIQAMTVSDFALTSCKPLSEIILTLLRQGVMATKNQVLDENTILKLANTYGIKTVQKSKEHAEVLKGNVKDKIVSENALHRAPVIVVVGHVDHGKTTFLDFIRNTKVAAKEKGGITQHLGAYEAKISGNSIVFLDTPGHEAFFMIRSRGLKVADIAILMVAGDDGVMPQTVEAIKYAKSIGLPIIVAINKADKLSQAQIDVVKRQLATNDLAPEDWGGQTTCMLISAKTGQGINELLDIIILQAELLELTADPSVPASGYILESKLEKGRGPVATVLIQQGSFRIGDYFKAGNAVGKISSVMDSFGKKITEVGPSFPVQVAGFSELPEAGDQFEVISAVEFKKLQSGQVFGNRNPANSNLKLNNESIGIVVKTDSASSREALVAAISKFSNNKNMKNIHIIDSSIGSVRESDVVFASDTHAIIYCFHVKAESASVSLAQKLNVNIRYFDIIYKLLEDLELLCTSSMPIKTVSKKIGEAGVLKVFDIKGLGVIAGAHIKSGIFSKDGKVIIFRGKHKIGEGKIKSLQRDKKAVKEVHTGFECAFMVEGFDAWQPEDRVECYLEVPV